MATTCFISFSHDRVNEQKVNRLNNIVNGSSSLINFSERKDKSMYSDETIWKYLHDRIAGSSCTILFLSKDLLTYNSKKLDYVKGDFINSGWIYNEISASLRDWKDNRINALVCVVDDEITDLIAYNNGVIKGSSLPEILALNSEYIVWVTYSAFIANPHNSINQAKQRREDQIRSGNTKYRIVYDLHSR